MSRLVSQRQISNLLVRSFHKIKEKEASSKYGMPDSPEYIAKKKFFAKFLTIYGRQTVLDALENDSIQVHKLHVAKEEKNKGNMPSIIAKAKQRSIEIEYHDDAKRIIIISRATNAGNTQGVCMDVVAPNIINTTQLIEQYRKKLTSMTFLAIDSVHTPKNVGLIIRSVASMPSLSGLIIPPKNITALNNPEVVRASTGAIFRTLIIKLDNNLHDTLLQFIEHHNALIYLLLPPSAHIKDSISISDMMISDKRLIIYVIGSESTGISNNIKLLLSSHKNHVKAVHIPMNQGINSLNAAMCSAIVCYNHYMLYHTRKD
jgi:23S rRNA (guanosine2251-2'-O)-methyltransferase